MILQLIMKQAKLQNKKEDVTDKVKQNGKVKRLSKIQNVDEDTMMFLLNQW
jgi:hypothetical protein